MRLQFGEFRFVDLGDLSGNTLGQMVCPINLLGEASVYLVAHHGNYDSNVPAVLTTKPAVVPSSPWLYAASAFLSPSPSAFTTS